MKKVVRSKFNENGNDYIVGDIHGCYEDLKKALELLNFDYTKDILYSVGDLVDRGPDSLSTIELIYEPWFRAIRGNHEQMMIDCILMKDTYYDAESSWTSNGGLWFKNHDLKYLEIVSEDADNLPYVIVLENEHRRINIVHAELYKNADLRLVSDIDVDQWNFDTYSEQNLVWGRSLIENASFLPDERKNLSPTYVGHTPVSHPLKTATHRYIDTGAVYFHTKNKPMHLTIVKLNKTVDNDEVYMYNMQLSEMKKVDFVCV